jgi:RNA polymerase sigma factor (sigma-70 family)
MSSAGSVTHWLRLLKAGDQEAARPLWQRYFRRLVGLARKKLADAPRRTADEDDLAQMAFASFCRGAQQGRFPHLDDRYSLWDLLVTITVRKATNLQVHERRQKRGAGRAQAQADGHDSDTAGPLAGVADSEPTPAFAAQVAEECQRLLRLLEDDRLRSIAVWKMEGHTTEEISAKLGCTPRTVERKLRVIRARWAMEKGP